MWIYYEKMCINLRYKIWKKFMFWIIIYNFSCWMDNSSMDFRIESS